MTNAQANQDLLDLSIVIPVRNEEDNIPELVERLTRVLGHMGASFEIIFATDINRDNTLGVLKDAHAKDPRVKTVKLSNGMGQHIAALAGMDASRGEAVVLMDGDLQDCPEDIPKLHAKMREGCDVVYAIKERKNEARWRNFLSSSFVTLLDRLSDYPIEHNTSMFRIMSRRTVDSLCRFREKEQNLTGLVSLIGFPTSRVLVESGARKAGQTNYGLLRQINMAVGFLLSFSTKPLRMISVFGFFVASLTFLYLIVLLGQFAIYGRPVQGWPTIVTLILFLGGVQILALGIVGEYIARIFIESKRRPLYIIEEAIGDLNPPKP